MADKLTTANQLVNIIGKTVVAIKSWFNEKFNFGSYISNVRFSCLNGTLGSPFIGFIQSDGRSILLNIDEKYGMRMYDQTNQKWLWQYPLSVVGHTATSTQIPVEQDSNGKLYITLPDNIFRLSTDENVTKGKANDTRTFWSKQPTGAYIFNTANQLNGQPETYGTLLHFNTGKTIQQQFFLTNGAKVYIRRCNASSDYTGTGTNEGWIQI